MVEFFVSNREKLVGKLNGGIVVLSAYSKMQRSNDTEFKFEQEANFWWLTGIEVADWQLIIDGTRSKSWLVAPKINEIFEVFDGSLAPEKAREISGVDAVISQDEADNMLRDLAKRHSVVYTPGDMPYVEYYDFTFNGAPKRLHEKLDRTFNSVQDCRKELAKLRAIKQPYEINCIKKAINLTIDAYEMVKESLPGFKHEYEIEAEFTYYFRRLGANGHAYDPIVAAGKNACLLHYMENNSRLKSRELIMMDIGARHHGYAADISRTYAFGEPTKRQYAVHQAVQTAHKRIIKLLKPDVSVEQYVHDADDIVGEQLIELGLIRDKANQKEVRKYFPHAISHGLGVDVHDSLGGPRVFQSGMVLTVEPGIYIPEEKIGVRIEDNILITEKGHTNLSGRLSTEL